MTTPVPHPERRTSSDPAHYRGTDTPAGDQYTEPLGAGRSGALTDVTSGQTSSRHGGHGLMMLVCCVPMVVVLLVVSGTASVGALVWALGCVVMMAAMMLLMPGGHGHK